MTALSYIYVVLGVAFIVAAALVVRIGARIDGAPPVVTEEHELAAAASLNATGEPGRRFADGRALL